MKALELVGISEQILDDNMALLSSIISKPTRTKCRSCFRIRQCTPTMLVLVVLILSIVTVTLADSSNTQKDGPPSAPDTSRNEIASANGDESSEKLDSTLERAKLSRARWQLAFEEIKNLTVPKSSSSSVTRWKLLLDNNGKSNISTDDSNVAAENDDDVALGTKPTASPRRKVRRFEGFPSWDRLLQDWADDVKEYTDRIDAETANKQYPMSTMGRPPLDSKPVPDGSDGAEDGSSTVSTSKDQGTDGTNGKQALVEDIKSNLIEISQFRKDQVKLPVPAPAKPGEAVLPHTEIADKSKRIWIVTTASLPWMTGTAVNPLLRAAYLNAGRKEAGGSVTLMLPWLERRQDQDAVYGAGKGFDSPEQQEEYVRTWLRETANLVDASETLNIEWYTAWQNKAENSLYSMGDITALIPAEEVDICILEEPEHLNWYVM